jgi:DNA-binding XRE family transcriptional regulator
LTIDLLNPPECGVALPPVGAPNPPLPAVTAGFSRLIADTRRHRKYSQRRLARMAGVSQPWLASVERGKARMDLGLILRVLAALEVRVTLEVEEGRD